MSFLEIENLTAFYGDFQALFGINMSIEKGETVAAIGANGAGKSTFLRSITGLVQSSANKFLYDGETLTGKAAADIVGLGIAMVPEGRRLFPSLSVEENLIVGSYSQRPGNWTLERVYKMFPKLEQRRDVPGTALSGGEQQMVAIGRALMSNPDILLCDELSLGLAPIIIKDIYDAIPEIKAEGISLLIVEQDINQALAIADRVYCFQEGRISLDGKPGDLTKDQIAAAYFGR
ncbi:MAG: ABC transporter ATP-binding protein [Rhodospirillaceae bacterium]|jgi:branched-chain amino acid transport system ATP-binding protein|nr:ABC transporter ATP-binding protein [Rhodospirillaceae bacterium]MBT4590266.1 ABC transporter ATP-binding protein [Rhodospirillaceae bacterium]MBT4940025.1 ABC transporter ATP-binding protein [Rhodospirillaceae bacterium]MBT5941116.1 ABC transporter ATP-binding protein [Rhodospirillaceae bacterium]MBT7266361.1 ABC transporter ATP-binding protein [Rhodospirillaceae bacterium]